MSEYRKQYLEDKPNKSWEYCNISIFFTEVKTDFSLRFKM